MTENVIKCAAKDRRKQIYSSSLNGIDYLEVITLDLSATMDFSIRGLFRGSYLIVYFFKPLTSMEVRLSENNVRFEGGVKVKNLRAVWAMPYSDMLAATPSDLPISVKEFNSLKDRVDVDSIDKDKALIVCPSGDGDFSTYTLRIVGSLNDSGPPNGFDVILSSIDFSFKIDEASLFDVKPVSGVSAEVLQEPVIDYLSKDYASFRHLALSRLALLIPDWKERNVADVGIMMAELLAYVGDYLSYYQDAVATEAYLGTSRSRISVKRHARLLDYYMHNGCNSRAWVCIETKRDLGDSEGDFCVVSKGTKFLTGIGDGALVVDFEDLEKEVSGGAKVFEAMHDLKVLYKNHSEIDFYTWCNSDYCLPKGSTQATLSAGAKNENGEASRPLNLKCGDVLIFEETHSIDGIAADRDISHRHAVRLKTVTSALDELTNQRVINIEWAPEDALPFSLCVRKNEKTLAVAHGNILLVDYGLSQKAEHLIDSNMRLHFRPRLKYGPLTFKGPLDTSATASSVYNYNLQDVKPDIYLKQLRTPKNEFEEFTTNDWLPGEWTPQQDLFLSNKFKTDFVVETENDGSAILRFGDGIHGLNPQKIIGEMPQLLYGFYRIGNGVEGNVGAESIKRIVNPNNTSTNNNNNTIVLVAEDIERIRNPLPARGGINPESIAMVRQNAPEAAKINERAVTDADYAEILKRKSNEIQSVVAKTRWTGSWYTVYVMVDRFGRKPVDEAFKLKVKNLLNQYRLSGYDIEVYGPKYVPLEIEVNINVSSNSLCSEVEKMLLEVFSNRLLSNGLKGFFHPDNFTFGQPVFLRDLFVTLSKVDGVASFSVKKFKRTDQEENNNNNVSYLSEGEIQVGPYEVIQLDNDANYPANGRIKFNLIGGR
ncbi:MAG: putative baseplate assembly protein [Candidatus Bathyarchaeota archaeon]|nr:putative baseplate assembly protein [Candidatus Termiticorpusculum sp.]